MTAVTTDRDRNGPRSPAAPHTTVFRDGHGVDELRQIPLAELVESPWNPRRHFDPARLAEMADSLKKGQLAPIIVRPWTHKGSKWGNEPTPYYEIGAGHRRYRSAPQAGLTSLLAIVRDLDDVAFLELLTIENKQRDDVAPLDEANGFKLLMEKAGYDVAKLAARIGLSTKYVYDRLKLLQLTPEAKQYLEDGTITAGHAILLARLTPAEQKRVIGNPKLMNRYGYSDGTGLFQPEHADHDPNQPALELKQPIKARSVRELATYINDHVRFDPATNDLPNLFPAAAVALEEAKTDDLTPVYITYDHQLKFDAKDHKVRTYGVMSWRRADGEKKSKTCDWSRIGIVAAGRNRGDAFRVCVNRDKCDVHFQASARAAKRRKSADRARVVPVDQAYTPTAAQKREQEKAQRDADLQELRDRLQYDVLAAHREGFLAAIAKRAAPFKAVPADVLLALMHDGEFWIPPATDWEEEISEVVGPSLPGKWNGKDRWPAAVKDAAAARSMIGLRLFVAIDAKKLDATFDREIQAAAEKALKAEAAEAKQLEKKPATKKPKKERGDEPNRLDRDRGAAHRDARDDRPGARGHRCRPRDGAGPSGQHAGAEVEGRAGTQERTREGQAHERQSHAPGQDHARPARDDAHAVRGRREGGGDLQARRRLGRHDLQPRQSRALEAARESEDLAP